MNRVTITDEENRIAQVVFDASKDVLAELGPGLLESAYESCLELELNKRGLQVERQIPISFDYKGIKVEDGFRIDLWVNHKIVVELKAVSELTDLHLAQLNTYLRLTGCNLGLLINFNVRFIGEGFRRWIVQR